MNHHPVIHIKPREGRRARQGAPWLFSNEIVMNTYAKTIPAGTLVDIEGDDGKVFGTGYFNPASLIAVRLLSTVADADIDEEFFAKKIGRALLLRQAIYAQPYYRLINAEGDALPGLTIDCFAGDIAIQITTAGMEALLVPLVAAIEKILSPQNIVLRADAPARALEKLESYVRAAKGEAGRIDVEENGVRYFADLDAGQKTGWYYDQRESRAFIASLARGKSVLDACCYSGGFALAAAKAGAREAVGVDSSAPALALAEDTAAANRLSCRFVKTDVFEALEAWSVEGQGFDIVVADPPPFVKSRKDLEVGARAYRKMAKAAAQATAVGGILMLASCSHNMPAERFAQECAAGIARAGRGARLIRASGAGPDHPTHPMLPESAYLKTLTYALD
jgi:23S rRNA (cytosine1962-C5)-methyltransferase